MKTFILSLIFISVSFSQVDFNTYFHDRTLRLDYFHTGNHNENIISVDEMIEEPHWGGSKTNLIDRFNLGAYKFEVYDEVSGTLIYSRTYTTLFKEWQTTDEAKQTYRTFNESVIFPYPKKNVIVKFFSRDDNNNFIEKFVYNIDPNNYFIKKERRHVYESFQIHYSGSSDKVVDIVIIPEGYTEDEMDAFMNDCKKFSGYLFNSSPFKEMKNKFNIWGVRAPSEHSGTDIPAENVWKKTILNSNFYTFDVERYLMTYDYKSVRDVAANVPYDQIYILVNSDKYGGGAIYNYYSVCVNKNRFEEYVFVHEFGHGFASLADEYYTSEVAYNDFYPLHLEPLDPNVTTLVDFESKWKNLVEENTPIPTPSTIQFKDKVGAFEGGGYIEKGVYRPMQDCTMKSLSVDNFCVVCKNAIIEMINFYAE